MAGKLLDGARGAASGVAGAARHFAWYLSYCVDGAATRSCAADEPVPEAVLRRVS